MQRGALGSTSRASATSSEDTNHTGGAGGAADGLGDATLSYLWFVTPLVATCSVLVVMVAVFTNQWLHTEEKMNNPAYNGTGDKDYLAKQTVSGLWMFCYTNVGETNYECNKIDYFTKEEYSPDPNDSTMAIPYAVTKSVFFFIAACCFLGTAYLCCILGYCAKHKGLYTFISGVAFIVTGLVMLFGLIMYISVFKAEIGSKLRPRSQLLPAVFTYHYGYSFRLYVAGFIGSQLAATCAIFLFIHQVQDEWRKQRMDDLRRGGGSGKSTCGGSGAGSSGCGGGAGGSILPPVNYMQLDQSRLYRPCRRHPQAYINSNSIHIPTNYPSPAHQRRYFFSKEPLQESSPCSLHRMRNPGVGGPANCTSTTSNTGVPTANSLRDLSSYYDFPPPPTISYQFDEHGTFSRDAAMLLRHLPRDLTATTISTTADIADGNTGALPCSPSIDTEKDTDSGDYLPDPYHDEYSPTMTGGVMEPVVVIPPHHAGGGHHHDFVTFDLDHQALPLRGSVLSVNNIRGGGGGGAGGAGVRKDYATDSLRRTTPV